jgi:N-acetylglucosamine-6-sulfatase
MNGLGKAGCVAAALSLTGHGSSAMEQPNILFVMVDDMAFDALSSGRFEFLKTPGLQRLTDEGALFENMLVTTSLCSPSRASILTGTYAHIHGVRYNEGRDPDPALPQFPQMLQKKGYKTALIGKWHMAPVSDPRPGFDYWLSFKGQGVYNNPELNENGRSFKAQGYITDILTEKTMEFIESVTNQPFCALLWHKANHGPFTPAPRHAEAFAGARFEAPESWFLDFSQKPHWMRRERLYKPNYSKWVASEGKVIPETLKPQPWVPDLPMHLNHLRCLLAVDEGLVQIMDLLEKQGRLDQTIVIFTADNGWFLGEHRRLGDKRLAYEESIRVPFVMRYPARVKPGSRISGMAANIDLAPTLLELAGAEIPASVQGESFVPMLDGRSAGRSDPFFYQYCQEEYAPGIPTILAIRTPEWKYISYPHESAEDGNFDELYHLAADPHELKNLIHSPEAAARLLQMRNLLEQAKQKTGYTEPLYQYSPPQKEQAR